MGTSYQCTVLVSLFYQLLYQFQLNLHKYFGQCSQLFSSCPKFLTLPKKRASTWARLYFQIPPQVLKNNSESVENTLSHLCDQTLFHLIEDKSL